MHLEISQEPLDVEIDRENAAAQSEHLDQTLAYTATARTPGIKDCNIFHNTVEIYIDYIYIQIISNNMYKNNRSDIKEKNNFTLTAWPSGMSLAACSAAHSSAEGDRQAEGEDCRNDACVGGVNGIRVSPER